VLDDRVPVTELLELAGQGDREASKKVFALLYRELRRLAAAQRARMPAGETMGTTVVVHEAYLRLANSPRLSWNGRHHFFCTAARTMRDILVDEARRQKALKRGGNWQRVDLGEAGGRITTSPEDLIALDLTLQKLEREHPDKLDIVVLRYFAGLSVAETADVLGLSVSTVERRWRFCRSWLARELGADTQADDG
jgi:RNA polymerase sigma factor (TIGR02999 family)